jgi:hypothetical protein
VSASDLFDAARGRLAGAPREGLGELVEPRRILGVGRAPRIVERGVVWHLGVLLVADDAVYSTGEVLRARGEARRGFTAESQRRRAELAAAARRGGFPEGATDHIGWRMLDLEALGRGEASGPLALVDGVASVRWSSAGGFVPLDRYLDERIGLLVDPPAGA